MLKISVKNLKIKGYHGVFEDEKINGVNLAVDVELFFKKQKIKDSIDETVNYVDIVEHVKRINNDNNFDLLETFCQNIINDLMKLYSPKSITVRIRKFNIYQKEELDFVEVEMEEKSE